MSGETRRSLLSYIFHLPERMKNLSARNFPIKHLFPKKLDICAIVKVDYIYSARLAAIVHLLLFLALMNESIQDESLAVLYSREPVAFVCMSIFPLRWQRARPTDGSISGLIF